MDHSVKAGMAETGAANMNTRSEPTHKRCRGHIHGHLKQWIVSPLLLLCATGREASLQRSWLQLNVVQVAPILGSGRSMHARYICGVTYLTINFNYLQT